MDLRSHLDISGPEDGTETDTHGGSTLTQEGDDLFPSSTEGGKVMQGEESRGGD